MADFNLAYRRVHGNEGGYANHKTDKGGETYRGISRVNHPTWPGWVIIDGIKKTRAIRWNEIIPDAALNALVMKFFQATWKAMGGDALKSQAVATFYYDFYTNSGGATKVLQRLLITSFGQRLVVDGLPGPATVAAINACEPASLHNELKKARESYVRMLVRIDPSQSVFLDNWIERIHSFPDEKKSPLPSQSSSQPPRPGLGTIISAKAKSLASLFKRPSIPSNEATA